MTGETDLGRLIATMRPVLDPAEYGFGQIPCGAALPSGLSPFATVAESEGLTVIAPAGDLARHAIGHVAGWARISLSVQSDLAAVGLTAAIAKALAEEGISANVIAGYLHDHVFVQWDRRHVAMAALARLAGAP
jgi:uncharacterized protein